MLENLVGYTRTCPILNCTELNNLQEVVARVKINRKCGGKFFRKKINLKIR